MAFSKSRTTGRPSSFIPGRDTRQEGHRLSPLGMRLARRMRESVKRFCLRRHYLRSSNSFSRGVSVNLEHCNLKIDEQIPVVAVQSQNFVQAGPRIERCEFEELLQRAMEILNARDLNAQLKTTA
jgi:hypothetical protein